MVQAATNPTVVISVPPENQATTLRYSYVTWRVGGVSMISKLIVAVVIIIFVHVDIIKNFPMVLYHM